MKLVSGNRGWKIWERRKKAYAEYLHFQCPGSIREAKGVMRSGIQRLAPNNFGTGILQVFVRWAEELDRIDYRDRRMKHKKEAILDEAAEKN